MKITEANLRNIIAKTIKESVFEQGMQQTPFTSLEEIVKDKAIDLENKAELIQYKVSLLNKVIPVLTNVDKGIKETFSGIQGPLHGDYPEYIIYTLSQPLQWEEKTDTYGGYDIEDGIKNMFPKELQQYVNVYTDEHKHYGTVSQLEIHIDIDDISEIPNEEY